MYTVFDDDDHNFNEFKLFLMRMMMSNDTESCALRNSTPPNPLDTSRKPDLCCSRSHPVVPEGARGTEVAREICCAGPRMTIAPATAFQFQAR